MVINFPSGNGPELNAQKTFEKSFEINVTDENLWNFEWDLPHDKMTIESAKLLPTMLAYPGSADSKWSVFPVGESSAGTASYDVSVFPHALVGGPSGTGKQLALNERLFSANKGWITVGDLEVGDVVFGVDGKETKVTHLHPIVTPEVAYKVTFRNKESVIVDADHLWETETALARSSRFNNINDESAKLRQKRFSTEIIKLVEEELLTTTDKDSISIPELAILLDTYPTRNYLHQLAKYVGPAEEIQPTQVFHYNAQTVRQNQLVSRVEFSDFVLWYNNRKEVSPTKKFPLVRGHYEKLEQLTSELRDTDVLTVDSVLEYLDCYQKISTTWVRENIDTNLLAPAMVKDLQQKAEGKYSLLPSQILVSIEDQVGMISKHDVSRLLGLSVNSIESMWSVAIRNLSKVVNREIVELIVPEKTVERKGTSYFTYPKKLILERVLADNVILWDQRDKLSAGTNILTTQEISDTLKTNSGAANHFVRKTEPIEFSSLELPINPYVFGAWLGDGNSKSGEICGIDHELFARCIELGYEPSAKSANQVDKRKHVDFRTMRFARLTAELKANNISAVTGHLIRRDGEVKHIPSIYLRSSTEQRRELLRGLLDTDGSVSKNTGAINLHSSNEILTRDVKHLIASLGYIPYITKKDSPKYLYKGETLTGKTAYTVSFQADPADRLFHLSRKNEAHKTAFRGDMMDYRTHSIQSVERVESVPMRCISVDSPDRLFLVSDSLIPTHNSVLQRNIVFHTIQHNDRWRFLGVDLKRVELTPYNKYKKTVMGIATELEQGLEVLKYAYNEMMDRYKEMESQGKNNVMDMDDPPKCILVMVDEATMFLGASGSKTDEGKANDAMAGEASDLVGKILRLGRAAGIHMLIAMQRPDATVLRGEFKANMDVRLAAGRMDSTPSSMILDSGEAVNLPGIRGRGIIRVGGSLTTFQGYFAPQDWIDNFILENPEREPSTVAPGGHLYEKYQALQRLKAQKLANPEAFAEIEAPKGKKAKPVKEVKVKKSSRLGRSKPETVEDAEPVVDEVEVPVEPETFEPVDDFIPVPEELSETHSKLLEALNKAPEDTLEGTETVRELPAFFTGGAGAEPAVSAPVSMAKTVEPELNLSDKDFILDDFDEIDDEEDATPLDDYDPALELPDFTAEVPEPVVEPVKPPTPTPVPKVVSSNPFAVRQPTAPVKAPVAPVTKPVVKPSVKPEPVVEEEKKPSLPVRPANPFAPRTSGSGSTGLQQGGGAFPTRPKI